MWLIMWALLAPPDPNTTYQSLDRIAKERVYLVYDREIKARQKFDEAIDATSTATRFDGGVVRLVVSELKRDGKFLEERKLEAKGLSPKPKKKKNDGTNPLPNRRRNTAGGAGTRPGRNPSTQKKEYSGDGITLEEGIEKVKFNGKTYKWFDFQRICTVALADKLSAVPEKEPLMVDAVVTGLAKHWTVVNILNADAQPGASVVILKPPSTKTLRGLKKGDFVRLWGWLADDAQIKAAEDAYSEEDDAPTSTDEEEEEEEERSSTEKQRPAGPVFFAMDLDEFRKQIPGLVLSTSVTLVTASDEGKEKWEIEVTAKNEGSQKLVHVEVETTMVIEDVKKTTKDPADSALVYFASIEPGGTATAKTRIENWTELDDEFIAIARPLNGKVAK
jgi:hypothetical protein